MIGKVNYSPSFQKQLKARATIQRYNEPEECYIYELSQEKDSKYFEKYLKLPVWDEAVYVDVFDMHIKDKEDKEHIYVMETAQKELLGMLQVNDDDKYGEYQTIEYLATSPFYSTSNNFYRERKYIGQTLLAFAVKNFDEKHTKGLCVPNPVSSAVDFYIKQCNFYPYDPDSAELIMHKKSFNKFLRKNEEKTQGGLELIG